jgi:hypothetical protein
VERTVTDIWDAVRRGFTVQGGRGDPINKKLCPFTRAIATQSAAEPSHLVGIDACSESVLLHTFISGDWRSRGTDGGRKLARTDNAKMANMSNEAATLISM